MHTNTYDGILEAWKVDLIRARARRHGVRPHDMGEVEQEIVRVVAEFCFDPAKSNGATERTALTKVIDNRLKNMRRKRKRYSDHLDRARRMSRQVEEDTTSKAMLVIDVHDAIAMLPLREQAVCQGLLVGQTLNQIAIDQGCAWGTIRRSCDAIREHFTAIGLGSWLGTAHD